MLGGFFWALEKQIREPTAQQAAPTQAKETLWQMEIVNSKRSFQSDTYGSDLTIEEYTQRLQEEDPDCAPRAYVKIDLDQDGQEELAIRLNVVRQTVSKWESGRSVPDADILLKIADVLDVSLSDLLGAELPNDEPQQNEIAAQLIRLNEQYAIRNRRSKRIWRVVLGVLVGLLALIVVGAVVFRVNFDSPTAQTTSQVVQDVEE